MKYGKYETFGLYERNYAGLMALFPELEGGLSVGVDIERPSRFALNIQERTKFTTTLSISQPLGLSAQLGGDPYIVVRIYHDARVAEVVAYQNYNRFLPWYPYPNPRMLQQREKTIVNRFLAEWLGYCLKSEGHRARGGRIKVPNPPS